MKIKKNVLITGGLGFIGSNLAHELVKRGAKVTILDNLSPLYGGNHFNVLHIKDKIEVIIGDVRDSELVNKLIVDKDIVFNLAAQVSYIDSNNMPYDDLDINLRAALNVLEAARKFNPRAKIIYSSSRLALGKIIQNPITEDHPAHPLSLYGIHKRASESYHTLYNKDHGLNTTVLRLTNPYGIRQQIKHSKYSIPGWFMRQAMEDKTIKIFGDGKQLRDYLFSSDIVEAFILVAISDKTSGKLYNIGCGKSIEFKKMVETIIKTVGRGKVEFVPWPKDYERNETGDFETSIRRITKDTGWKPKTKFADGIKKMYQYYK